MLAVCSFCIGDASVSSGQCIDFIGCGVIQKTSRDGEREDEERDSICLMTDGRNIHLVGAYKNLPHFKCACRARRAVCIVSHIWEIRSLGCVQPYPYCSQRRFREPLVRHPKMWLGRMAKVSYPIPSNRTAKTIEYEIKAMEKHFTSVWLRNSIRVDNNLSHWLLWKNTLRLAWWGAFFRGLWFEAHRTK